MDAVAYIGGFLLGIQMIPQIYKIYISKSVDDISWYFLLINIIGLSCMMTYGLSKNDMSLYIPICLSLVCTIFVGFQKYQYTPVPSLSPHSSPYSPTP
jgi:uncharacterized protein with PQ loop repeat